MPDDPIDEPVCLRIDFYLPRPGYLLGVKAPQGVIPCAVRPDIDNCCKLILDALNTVWTFGDGFRGIWRDDVIVAKLVTKMVPDKKRAEEGGLKYIGAPGTIPIAMGIPMVYEELKRMREKVQEALQCSLSHTDRGLKGRDTVHLFSNSSSPQAPRRRPVRPYGFVRGT